MRRLGVILASVAMAVVVAACTSGGGSAGAALKLDGSPRHPDDQGIATEVGRHRIILDGRRRYSVSPALNSFSTYTLETVPLVTRRGQYVQIGLQGKTVVWIAGIAGVIPSKPPRVFYIGELKRVEGRDAIFKDGTVLRLAANVAARAKPGHFTAVIDPKAHQIVELRP